MNIHAWWPRIGSWILAGIFMGTGILKIADPQVFALDVAHYRLLPWWGSQLAAVVLPAWEIATGAALLIPRWQQAGALTAAGLGGVFLGAVISALVRGLDIACGCFGSGSHRIDAANLALDVFLICLALGILISVRTPNFDASDHSPK
ncbi:MAG: DoxX family protein [Candidatus Firestonebacteria bacterium]|nr:DoxX family protein [Candidatus Firestonebacteria bacterium]